MSFFDSEVVRAEMAEISELQEEIYGSVFTFPTMTKEEKIRHVDLLDRLLNKQRILYTRLSLSDDPEAKEMKERKDRIDDALQATKAALEEGILSGAGVALLNARNAINDRGNSDFGKGGAIVFKACSRPFFQILHNAGEDSVEWMDVLKNTKNMVPDIVGEKTVDAFESGIIDPTKVVRCALENAAAAAVTLLMTECVIHDKPSDKKKDEVDMSGFGM